MAKGQPGPGLKPKYTVTQVCQALDQSRGMITLAADHLKCSTRTVHNYINQHEKVKEVLESHRMRRIDRAEFALDDKVEEGDLGAIKYVLSCLGRDRGYGEKSEHTHLHNFGTIEVPATADPNDWESIAQSQLGDHGNSDSDK